MDEELLARLGQLEAFQERFKQNPPLDNALRGPLRLTADHITGLEALLTDVDEPEFVNDEIIRHRLLIPDAANIQSNEIQMDVAGTYSQSDDSTNKWIRTLLEVAAAASPAYSRARFPVATRYAPVKWSMVIATNTDHANATFRAGLGSAALTANPSNGIFFRRAGTGNWFAVVRNGGSETATDTGTAGSATPQVFRIVVNSSTSVEFYIGGVLEHTETGANIPAVGSILYPSVGLVQTTNNTVSYYISNWMYTERKNKVA